MSGGRAHLWASGRTPAHSARVAKVGGSANSSSVRGDARDAISTTVASFGGRIHPPPLGRTVGTERAGGAGRCPGSPCPTRPQAMDTAHVCLIAVHLRDDAFELFRCDRPRSIGAHALPAACSWVPRRVMELAQRARDVPAPARPAAGLSLKHLAAVFKCSSSDDTVTLSAQDEGDTLHLVFDNHGAWGAWRLAGRTAPHTAPTAAAPLTRLTCAAVLDRTAEFSMKLMEIECDQMGIPDQEYAAQVTGCHCPPGAGRWALWGLLAR